MASCLSNGSTLQFSADNQVVALKEETLFGHAHSVGTGELFPLKGDSAEHFVGVIRSHLGVVNQDTHPKFYTTETAP